MTVRPPGIFHALHTPNLFTLLQLISIANNSKERKFRQRADDLPTPKLLARVEQLRLLSKLEELKLLSLLQNNGRPAGFATAAARMCTPDHRMLTRVASCAAQDVCEAAS